MPSVVNHIEFYNLTEMLPVGASEWLLLFHVRQRQLFSEFESALTAVGLGAMCGQSSVVWRPEEVVRFAGGGFLMWEVFLACR